MNYFDSRSAAERYARGRPYFHPQVIARIKAHLSLTEPVRRAIDVGCGTGLSAIALKEIAHSITGVDLSAEMIALAPPHPQIEYLVAPAEKLPAGNADFDLMTLSSAFHWLISGEFFAEARRVLRSRGWLVVYENCFSGQMQGSSLFQQWFRDRYLGKYPSPPRVPFGLDAANAAEGFRLTGQEDHQNTVRFSVNTLVDYLVTQSNVIAAVEGGSEQLEEVKQWLTEGVSLYFGDESEADFIFRGSIWYLRKTT